MFTRFHRNHMGNTNLSSSRPQTQALFPGVPTRQLEAVLIPAGILLPTTQDSITVKFIFDFPEDTSYFFVDGVMFYSVKGDAGLDLFLDVSYIHGMEQAKLHASQFAGRR